MGLCSSGRRLSLSWVEEQVEWVGWSKVKRAFQVRTTCRKAERPERVWVGLGAVGDRAGKAGEWNRMELHYGSSRKFSVLRGLSTLWSGNRRTANLWVKNRTTDKDSEKIFLVQRLEAKSVETTEEVVALAVAVWGDGGQSGVWQTEEEERKSLKWPFEEKLGKLARPIC